MPACPRWEYEELSLCSARMSDQNEDQASQIEESCRQPRPPEAPAPSPGKEHTGLSHDPGISWL